MPPHFIPILSQILAIIQYMVICYVEMHNDFSQLFLLYMEVTLTEIC